MNIIKTIKTKETWQEDDFHKDTHLVNPVADGEFTMCGSAYVDELKDTKKYKKVTCKLCIIFLNQYKALYDEFYGVND